MKRFLAATIAALGAVAAFASVAPDQLVKDTTDRVLSELTANRSEFEHDHEKLYRMVDEIVLPHFDFERMARLVLGRYWRDANDAQRQQFVQEFKTLLVRTYATALFEYTGQKIIYKPFRAGDGDSSVVVKTEVVPSDGPPIPMHYSLNRGGEGSWKVYDIKIDGISLVTNYRTSYGNTIQNQGIDALISSLVAKNRELMKQ